MIDLNLLIPGGVMIAAVAYLLLRKKNSNPGPAPVPTPNPSPNGFITGNPVKRKAGVAPESFFSALVKKDGTKLAGTYSFPDQISHIIEVGKGVVASLHAGESVFSMIEHGGYIYASCENKGKVYRSKTGEYKFQLYKTLRPGLHGGAFGMGVVFGKLVIIGGGEIFVKGIGTVKTFDKDIYVKWPYQFKGKCIVPGYRRFSDSAGWYESKDLKSWVWKTHVGKDGKRIKGHRFMSAAIRPDGKEMVLCGSDNYTGGKHHDNSASIYKCVDGSVVEQQGHFGGYDYTPVCTFYNNDQLLFGPNRGWRDSGSNAPLMERRGGAFKTLATFPEPEIRAIEIAGDKVLVVTRKDRVVGRAYLVGGEKVADPKYPSVASIGGGFRWKPRSEKNGRLVILLPSSWKESGVRVNDERGKYAGRTNGNRPTYRFYKHGSMYTAPVLMQYGGKTWIVPKPGEDYR